MLFLEASHKSSNVSEEWFCIVARSLVDIRERKPLNVSDLKFGFSFENRRLWQTLGGSPIWNNIKSDKLIIDHLQRETLEGEV